MNSFDLRELELQHDHLRRIARAIVGDAYADDVVQDAWAAALAHRDPAPGNWGGWLNRVTHNLAWKRRLGAERGAARERERAADGPRTAPAPEDVAAEIETKHVIERAILELDEPYRSVLLWRYYEGLSIEEVSRRAGTIPSTTRTHVQRGLDRLRARLRSERGSEWRLALVPFLRHEPIAANAAGVSLFAGVLTMTWIKWCVGSLIVTALGVLVGSRLDRMPARTPHLAPDADVESSVMAIGEQPGEQLVTVDPSQVRATVEVDSPPIEPTAMPAPPTATMALIDDASGLPLPGVALTVRGSVVTREFLTGRTDELDVEVVTDDDGRFTLPVEVHEDGSTSYGTIHGTIAADQRPILRISCTGTRLSEDGSLQLIAESSAAFWVRLPESLSGADSASATLTLCFERPPIGLEVFGERLTPAAIDGRDVLVLVPRYFERRRGPRNSGVVKIATTSKGPSFEAPFQRLPSLADAPLAAVRSPDITHTFRVVDDESGDPVEGAYVNAGLSSEVSDHHAAIVARAATNESGEAELIGVPATDVRVTVKENGYDDFEWVTTPTAGGTSELRLRPIPDLRDVVLTIRPHDGDPPETIWCKVSEEDGGTVHHASCEVDETGSPWVATHTLEHIPSTVAFLEVYVFPPSYDPLGPIRIEPGTVELEVDLAHEVPLVPIVLDLPLSADARYYQEAQGRKFSGYNGFHSGISEVTTAPDDGRPVIWVVDAPGFVPVVGTEEDWHRSTFEGRPCVRIAPEMRPGWGSLIRAVSVERKEGEPFQFRTLSPIPNATIHDTATGQTLAVTDANGYAVVTADAPLEEIEARYGRASKLIHLRGARSTTFGF